MASSSDAPIPSERMVALPVAITDALGSLADAKGLEALGASELLQQLQAAQAVAQRIRDLPLFDPQNLRDEIAAQELALLDAQQQNRNHLSTINALTAAANRPVEALAHPREEKIPDPDKFDGTRAKLRTFIDQLRLKVGDHGRYPTEQSKLRYAFSRLEGAAFDQVRVYLGDDQITLNNMAELIRTLQNAFDDPDRTATAERHLRALKQANRDFPTYYAEFMRYAPDTTRNDSAKRSMLRAGLSHELLDRLVTTDEPEGWEGFVELCKKVDRKMRALGPRATPSQPPRPTSRSALPPALAPAPAPAPAPSTAVGSHAGPMDLSAFKRQLSPEERLARLREGRCLYCGGLGHLARDCPNKRPRRLQANALAPAPASLPREPEAQTAAEPSEN